MNESETKSNVIQSEGKLATDKVDPKPNSPIRIQVNNQDIEESNSSLNQEDEQVEPSGEVDSTPFAEENETKPNDDNLTKTNNAVPVNGKEGEEKVEEKNENKNDANEEQTKDDNKKESVVTSDLNEEKKETPTVRSSVIVAPSRLNVNNPSTSNSIQSQESDSTNSSKAAFSSFSSRKEASDSGSSASSSNRSFFLAKSRLPDVDQIESNNSNNSSSSCNIKVTLKPSVLKVKDDLKNDSSETTKASTSNGNPFSLFRGKDAGESAPIRFTPLSSVFKTKTTSLDSDKSIADKDTKTEDASKGETNPNTNGLSSEKVSVFSTFAATTSSVGASSGGFVFGQNLEERVTNVAKEEENANEESKTNLTPVVDPSPTLIEKRKYENITGEEDESNVMQIYCKLYQWSPETSGWKEKGKGNLRLNDRFVDDKKSSRLIMRTCGSLKLILNCLLVHGMKFEVTNDCLRFSTVDGIQLIKGKSSEIEQLCSAVEQRLRDLPKRSKTQTEEEKSKASSNGRSSPVNETASETV